MNAAAPRILLVGPQPIVGNHNRLGGTTISFAILVDFLRRHQVPHRIVDSQKFSGLWRLLFGLIYPIWQVFWLSPRSDIVMINVAQKGTMYAGPLMCLAAKIWGKPVAFRMFGGDLIELYEAAGWLHRWILQKTVLRADLMLLQTQRLVDYFRPMCLNIQRLPTSRTKPTLAPREGPYRRRFVYIGRVMETKGVDQILAARERLGPEFVIELYGPIVEPKYQRLAGESFYRGVLAPEQVATVLRDYDVLLLPTYFPGEGYPGVVFEANSVGLPVIATRWLALPEIVSDGESGRLIAPHSVEELVSAIRSFDESNYAAFSQAALTYFGEFDSEIVNLQLLQRLRDAATNNRR